MPKDFVEHGLNIIVKRLTGISHFFSKHEMDCNAMGIYFGDKSDKGVKKQRIRAEKKEKKNFSSLNFFIFFINKKKNKLLFKKNKKKFLKKKKKKIFFFFFFF